jgi:hypothetical protein
MLRRCNALKYSKIKMQFFLRMCKNSGAKCQKIGENRYFQATKQAVEMCKYIKVLNNKTLQYNNVCDVLKMSKIKKISVI